jgi:ABC-type sugar transport system permease subunit
VTVILCVNQWFHAFNNVTTFAADKFGPAHDAVAIPRSVYLFMIDVYRQMFNFQRFGYSLALLWIMVIMIVVLTLLLIRTSRYWVYYESDVEGETGA